VIEPQYTTKFAPPERANSATIQNQKSIIDNLFTTNPFLDNIPAFILVLNKERQIVYANKLFLDLIGKNTIYGMRPGECVDCIHAWEENGGCGTSEFCSECGAVNAILNSQKNGFDIQECRITQNNNDVLDLNIWSKKIIVENNEFTLFSFVDISNEKRRKVLEKIFFHDVLNTAGSLSGFLGLLKESEGEELEEFMNIAEDISIKLIDEIKSQRTLSQAEDGELKLSITDLSTRDLLEEVIILYKNNIITDKQKLEIEQGCADVIISTDKTILRRVLGNLAKNALEASPKGETVLLNCTELEGRIVFSVKNSGFIPKKIQLQIFQRSFSTKGLGRGIGTYSVKLLSERYLNSSVSFESYENSGTVFKVSCPKKIA